MVCCEERRVTSANEGSPAAGGSGAKIAADVDSADLSDVSRTPTIFVNGKRHHGAYDISTLSEACGRPGHGP